MDGLRFRLNRVEEEPNTDLDACKLLGSPVMPAGFMDSLKLKPEDYFVAQIRCDAFPAKVPFPEKGYLYIFVNIDTKKPRVFYTEKDPEELIDDVNAGFDAESCGDPTCLQMQFVEEDSESFLFGEIDPDIGLEGDTVTAGKCTLLQIDAFDLPQDPEQRPLKFGNFGFGDGYWVFLIKEEDLIARNFKKVEFIEIEA